MIFRMRQYRIGVGRVRNAVDGTAGTVIHITCSMALNMIKQMKTDSGQNQSPWMATAEMPI